MRLPLRTGLFVCAFVSGLASLIYEVVWLREVGLLYGQTLSATGIVLAAFMAGMALGSVFWGRKADRSMMPVQVYGFLELGMGLSALLLVSGFGHIERLTVSLSQHLPSLPPLFLRIPLAFLLLLLPTFFLGGTLPALGRCLAATARDAWTGRLYGLSTLGAALGAFLSAFVFLPSLGSRSTNLLAALLSCAVGVTCLAVGRWRKYDDSPPARREKTRPHATRSAAITASFPCDENRMDLTSTAPPPGTLGGSESGAFRGPPAGSDAEPTG